MPYPETLLFMPVTLSFFSRYLTMSIRRHGLQTTNEDTALTLYSGQWSLPSGADGQFSAEELHQLASNVASEDNAGSGPDCLWALVAEAQGIGLWSALEVTQTLSLFTPT